jgi:MFS family permease
MRKSPLLPIFLIVLVDILGMAIILPLLPFYAETFGATPQVVGLLITIYAACQLVAGPLLGKISDRMGRRPLLLVSQAGTFVGFLILAFSKTLWLIFLSRIIDGLTAGNLSLAQAYISDVTEAKDRAHSFALIGVAFGVGFLLGPALSGFLAQYSYQYPIFAAAALSFTSILGSYFLLPKTTPTPPSGASGERRLDLLDWGHYARYFKQPELAPLLWQFALFCLAFASFTSGFALFAERRYVTGGGLPFGPREVGYVFAYVGFLGIILQGGLVRPLVKRFGEKQLVIWGFLSGTAGFALLGFTYTVPALLIVAAFCSFGTGVLRPSLTSLVTQSVGRSEQGVILGLTQSLFSIAQIAAPLVAGFLIERTWLAPWALLTSAFMMGGLFLARRSIKTA